MKKFYSSLLILLFGFSMTAFASPAQSVNVHLSKIAKDFTAKITVQYVTCQGGPPCQKSTLAQFDMDQSSDYKLPYQGTDLFIVSLKTPDGNVIWGQKDAVFDTNSCRVPVNGSNSVTFTSNFDGSITCKQGMD